MRKLYPTLLSALLSVPAMFAGNASAPAKDATQDISYDATITQIDPLKWKVIWKDWTSISARDSEYDQNYATLTDAKGKTTILHANLHGATKYNVIFPDYANYFTLDLEGLGLADGTYTLNIPEGYVDLITFGVGTYPNGAQEFHLTIGDIPEIEYTPRFTDFVDNYFDVTWENVVQLNEGITTGSYIKNIETGEKYAMEFLEGDLFSKANIRIYNDNALRVNITNNYPTLPPGTYRFYLPANYVTFNGSSTGNMAIDNYEFTYVRSWNEGNVEFNGPSEDNKITLKWVDASEIRYNTNYPGDGEKIKGVTIFDGAGSQIDVSYEKNITICGNRMTIDLNDLNLTPGECNVLVPDDSLWVTVDGDTQLTFGVSFMFNYDEENMDPVGPEAPLYSGAAIWNIREGQTVYADMLVEISWGDNIGLSFVKDAEPASVHSFETGILYLDGAGEVYLSEDKTRIILNLGKIMPWIYRINVPEGFVEFEVDGITYRNQATSMSNITISDLDGVYTVTDSADVPLRVVNINGITVLDTDDGAGLNTLPKGLYIVNGKKIVK